MSTSKRATPGRQLTLGEVQAAIRAEARESEHGALYVSQKHAVEAILKLRVCDVCGWTRRAHTGALRERTCGSYRYTPRA